MPYTFLNASLPIQLSPKQSMINDFQNALNKGFYVTSDWFTIQREFPYGSKELENIDVRVTRTFDGKNGVSIADDYKRLLFKNPSDSPYLGSLFHFDDNYWIVVNIEAIKSLGVGCVVRRCNNMLRWKDYNTGVIYEEPCAIDYLIKETRDYSTGYSIVQPSGFIDVITQFNARSNKIRPNRRFLFGNTDNWLSYKLMGGGLNNFDNRKTENNVSVGLIRLSMLATQSNEQSDDFVNGIADALEYDYTLTLNSNSLTMEVNDSFILIPEFKINGVTNQGTYVWTSNNTLVATVDNAGNVSALSSGTALIKCQLADNPDVFDTCTVGVGTTPISNYEIVVSPISNYIFEGEEQTFTVDLYLNSVVQPDTFTFTLNPSDVPSENYVFTVLGGNSFKIKNLKRYYGDKLSITLTSGANTKTIFVEMKGAY